MQAEALNSGIFARENGQRLLQILLKFADRGFECLYERCKHDLQGDYYQTGLRRVNAWPDNVIDDDTEHVRKSCPDLTDTYESCYSEYVTERFGSARSRMTRPELSQFVRQFLEAVGSNEYMRNGEFFSQRNIVINRVVCMDAARSAFSNMLAMDSHVELQSTVSTVKPIAISLSQASEQGFGREREDEILPSDSISNIDAGRKESEVEARLMKRSHNGEALVGVIEDDTDDGAKEDQRHRGDRSRAVSPDRSARDDRSAVRDDRSAVRDDRSTASARDDRSAVRDDRSAVRDDRSAVRDDRSAVRDDRSAVRDDRSAVRDDRSAVRDDRSAVRDDRSAVRDDRSAVSVREDRSAIRDDRSAVRDDRSAIRDDRSAVSVREDRRDDRSTRDVRDTSSVRHDREYHGGREDHSVRYGSNGNTVSHRQEGRSTGNSAQLADERRNSPPHTVRGIKDERRFTQNESLTKNGYSHARQELRSSNSNVSIGVKKLTSPQRR